MNYEIRLGIAYARDTLLAQLPEKPNWVDGSSLSRYNLFTPRDVVWVLERILQRIGLQGVKQLLPDERLLFDSLPCVFEPGVLHLFAKSGTLHNNFNLSGYLIEKSRRILLFSYMNNHFLRSRQAIELEVITFLKQLYEHF